MYLKDFRWHARLSLIVYRKNCQIERIRNRRKTLKMMDWFFFYTPNTSKYFLEWWNIENRPKNWNFKIMYQHHPDHAVNWLPYFHLAHCLLCCLKKSVFWHFKNSTLFSLCRNGKVFSFQNLSKLKKWILDFNLKQTIISSENRTFRTLEPF